MEQAISTEVTSDNIARVTSLLANSPVRLADLSAGRSGEQLRQPLGAGERSFTEGLAHLIHSEARSSEAIYLALLVDEPEFVPVHPERQFGKLVRFDRLDFSDLLAYFKTRRAVLLQVLASLTMVQWLRVVRESRKQRKESVYWRTRSLALHELEHLDDLALKLDGFQRGP